MARAARLRVGAGLLRALRGTVVRLARLGLQRERV